MEKNRDFVTEQIAALNAEIHSLKNRLTVIEIQLESTLENIKTRRQLWVKIRREFFTVGCVALSVLLILMFRHSIEIIIKNF